LSQIVASGAQSMVSSGSNPKYCIVSNDQFSKIIKDNKFESTSSYFTDEEEMISPNSNSNQYHNSDPRNIQNEFY